MVDAARTVHALCNLIDVDADFLYLRCHVVLGLVIAVAGGTLIEKLHLESYVEDFIRGGNSLDVPQEELHFKDRIKFAWEQVIETAKKVAPYVLIGVGIGAFIHNGDAV